MLKEGFFTPGQMAGRLILNRATGEIVFFRMYLPQGSINFDVNRRVFGSVKIDGKEVEREFMATDAGFAPRMELIGGKQDFGNRLPWRKQKSEAEMNAALAQQFYRFKRIQWIEFGRAAALARTTGKPLHVISLEGTLDDESC